MGPFMTASAVASSEPVLVEILRGSGRSAMGVLPSQLSEPNTRCGAGGGGSGFAAGARGSAVGEPAGEPPFDGSTAFLDLNGVGAVDAAETPCAGAFDVAPRGVGLAVAALDVAAALVGSPRSPGELRGGRRSRRWRRGRHRGGGRRGGGARGREAARARRSSGRRLALVGADCWSPACSVWASTWTALTTTKPARITAAPSNGADHSGSLDWADAPARTRTAVGRGEGKKLPHGQAPFESHVLRWPACKLQARWCGRGIVVTLRRRLLASRHGF